MKKRNVFIDGIKVDFLINSKLNLTWFKMVDGTIKAVLTLDWEKERESKNDVFLISI